MLDLNNFQRLPSETIIYSQRSPSNINLPTTILATLHGEAAGRHIEEGHAKFFPHVWRGNETDPTLFSDGVEPIQSLTHVEVSE